MHAILADGVLGVGRFEILESHTTTCLDVTVLREDDGEVVIRRNDRIRTGTVFNLLYPQLVPTVLRGEGVDVRGKKGRYVNARTTFTFRIPTQANDTPRKPTTISNTGIRRPVQIAEVLALRVAMLYTLR